MFIYIYPHIGGNILPLSTPFLQHQSIRTCWSTTEKEEMHLVARINEQARKNEYFKQGKTIKVCFNE